MAACDSRGSATWPCLLISNLSLRKKVSRDDSARVTVLLPLREEMAGQPHSSLHLCPKESE